MPTSTFIHQERAQLPILIYYFSMLTYTFKMVDLNQPTSFQSPLWEFPRDWMSLNVIFNSCCLLQIDRPTLMNPVQKVSLQSVAICSHISGYKIKILTWRSSQMCMHVSKFPLFSGWYQCPVCTDTSFKSTHRFVDTWDVWAPKHLSKCLFKWLQHHSIFETWKVHVLWLSEFPFYAGYQPQYTPVYSFFMENDRFFVTLYLIVLLQLIFPKFNIKCTGLRHCSIV